MAVAISRGAVVIVLAILLVFLMMTLIYRRDNPDSILQLDAGMDQTQNGHMTGSDVYVMTSDLIRQRNNLSRALNLKQQKIGQMHCEQAHIQSKKESTSETGGWCAKSSKEDSGHHKTDEQLIPVLAKFFKGKSVASFGDGPGRYKQKLLATGLLKGYDAYDGAPFSEKTSEGRVSFLDLTLPQYGLPLYGWVISLEVAEHIPKEYESIYVDNVVRHALEGIVLSWAKPGQAGYSHVNNQAFEYVRDMFDRLGFEHDADASEKLKQSATLEWLQWNTNVYRRKDRSSDVEKRLMLDA